ncbi:TPA: lipid kinase [Stenotrophomonas maltophilia]|uniref:lipid kinase n=1 Tax=Stenotrophomonas maltophilia TaxID=40324 RepID=UPI0013112803|nr:MULTISPECIES: lipid kinase [Stenotrophomonas]MCO7496893.1 lipid kinase [Stenotrophomonas maltophilia]
MKSSRRFDPRSLDEVKKSPQSALLLLNERARRGADLAALARRLLAEHGIRSVEPSAGQSFQDAIREHGEAVCCVIVGGGDGTLNGCVEAVAALGKPLGILPLGTANDFARSMRIPPKLSAAVDCIINGKAVPVDIGLANGLPYLNVASVGFSAELSASLTASSKKRWGKIGYAINAARLLAKSRLFSATIQHDGRTERFRTFQVSVGNGRFYGGGMTVHQSASPTDGMLDVYSLELSHWWKMLALLPALRRGTHGARREVRSFSSKALTLHARRRLPVNLDGELRTYTPVHFLIREKALLVYAP